MSTITEPTSEKAIKQKIVSFFEYLDSNLEGRDIPIKITYISRDKTKKVITKKREATGVGGVSPPLYHFEHIKRHLFYKN